VSEEMRIVTRRLLHCSIFCRNLIYFYYIVILHIFCIFCIDKETSSLLNKTVNSAVIVLYLVSRIMFVFISVIKGVTFYPNTPKHTQIHQKIVFIVLVKGSI
jgi:fumarate reductase subunit C